MTQDQPDQESVRPEVYEKIWRTARQRAGERGYVVMIMEEPGDDPQPASYRYGSAAVDTLIARIGQGEPGDVLIRGPMSLVPRRSVAGPPAGRADQRGR